MQTELLFESAHQFLKERPSLAKEQLEDPLFSLMRGREELDELVDSLVQGLSRDEILGELTDYLNFTACATYILFKQWGFTEEEIVDRSRTIYQVTHAVKYPAEHYQNGTPPQVSLNEDRNRWEFAKTYRGNAFNQNPEYY